MSLPPDVSTDYGPIIESAVAALGRNTPDARREAYARVRAIIAHHLLLSGLSDQVVELEKLALDLAISKIERRWRMHEAAEGAVRKTPPKHETRDVPTPQTRPPPSPASGERPERRREGFGRLAAIVRPRAIRMGLAIALPIAIAVLIAILAGNNLWYGSLPDRPKSQDRLLAGPEPAGGTPDASPAANAASSSNITKVRPVRGDFGAVP